MNKLIASFSVILFGCGGPFTSSNDPSGADDGPGGSSSGSSSGGSSSSSSSGSSSGSSSSSSSSSSSGGPSCQTIPAGHFYGAGSFDGTDACGQWLYRADNINGDGGNTGGVIDQYGVVQSTTGAPNDTCSAYAGLGLTSVICTVPSCTVYNGELFVWPESDGGAGSEWEWYWMCPGGIQVPPQSAGTCTPNIACPDAGQCNITSYWCSNGY